MSDKVRERTIYWTVIAILVLGLAAMLVVWNLRTTPSQAELKAEELVQAFEDAGLDAPYSALQVSRVLGDDGGAVCAAAADPDTLGALRSKVGVGGEFYFRPAITTQDAIKGLDLIVSTYCPDHLPQVRQFERGVTAVEGS